MRVLPRRQAREVAVAQVERLAQTTAWGRDKAGSDVVVPFAMEAAALDEISTGVQMVAAVRVYLRPRLCTCACVCVFVSVCLCVGGWVFLCVGGWVVSASTVLAGLAGSSATRGGHALIRCASACGVCVCVCVCVCVSLSQR